MQPHSPGSESVGTKAETHGDVADLERLHGGCQRIREQLSRVIVGQDAVLEELLIALFAGGHCILEGVPGLAKTMMISTLARCLALSFSRIQFTPDLMPSDITGTEVLQDDKAAGTRSFQFLRGPIFANVILADEINRTPPKTQAALLEAMQERQVTVGNDCHALPLPFFVLATQNPIEQEGTYALPEAQQDRFMFKTLVRYPSYDEEYAIAERTTADDEPQVEAVFTQSEISAFQHLVRRIPAASTVIRYAVDLVRATRPDDASASPLIRSMVTWGAGPRAVQALIVGGKARAALGGRGYLAYDDIRELAPAVLRHRLVTNYSAEADGYDTDRVVGELLDAVRPPQDDLTDDDRIARTVAS